MQFDTGYKLQKGQMDSFFKQSIYEFGMQS